MKTSTLRPLRNGFTKFLYKINAKHFDETFKLGAFEFLEASDRTIASLAGLLSLQCTANN
jgi:hypothetical protein